MGGSRWANDFDGCVGGVSSWNAKSVVHALVPAIEVYCSADGLAHWICRTQKEAHVRPRGEGPLDRTSDPLLLLFHGLSSTNLELIYRAPLTPAEYLAPPG